MKQLISLLFIILVTIISWSSCARNKVINNTKIYDLSYSVVPTLITLNTLKTNDSLTFPKTKALSEHNRFFELSIIFNEKLQQIISLLTHSDNEKNNVVNNTLLLYTQNQSTINACKGNS